LTAWLVVEVGVFASSLVGTLAERNLFPLAPLFFLGLVAWLQQGAPRRRVATAVVVGVALGLIALLPAGLVTETTQWEAFSLVPFYDLRAWDSAANPRVLLVAAALPLLALAAFPPPRRLWLVPAALLLVLAFLSGYATHTALKRSRSAETLLLGKDRRWIDRRAQGPAAFLTGGEALWTAVYENAFWNRDLRRVYTLPGFGVPGPLPQTTVGPEADGRIVDAAGAQMQARYVLASNTLTLFGKELAAPAKAKLVLWRVRPPLRLSTWVTGISIVRTTTTGRGDLSIGGSMGSDAKLTVYACSGSFKLKLVGHAEQTGIRILRNGSVVQHARVGPWAALHTSVPAVARVGACDLEIISTGTLDVLLELNRD
jgi:hypothetical protein